MRTVITPFHATPPLRALANSEQQMVNSVLPKNTHQALIQVFEQVTHTMVQKIQSLASDLATCNVMRTATLPVHISTGPMCGVLGPSQPRPKVAADILQLFLLLLGCCCTGGGGAAAATSVLRGHILQAQSQQVHGKPSDGAIPGIRVLWHNENLVHPFCQHRHSVAVCYKFRAANDHSSAVHLSAYRCSSWLPQASAVFCA